MKKKQKRLPAGVAAIALSVGLATQSVSAETIEYRPLIIGHRGAVTNGISESSYPSFRYALDSGPNTIVEFDVHWTSDNKMVVMHDGTLDRTTNCTGLIRDKTYDYIAKNCFSEDDTGLHTVPSARGAINYAGTRAIAPQIGDVANESKVATFASYLVGKDATVQTTLPDTHIPWMRAAGYKGEFTFVTWGDALPTVAWLKARGVSTIAPCATSCTYPITLAEVRNYQDNNIDVWGWTALGDSDHADMAALEVDGIITNEPRAAVNYFN